MTLDTSNTSVSTASNIESVDKLLSRGVGETIGKENLMRELSSGKKLVIKLGADPTKPDLHLGHLVVLKKLKEFQEFGHRVIFIIGDYTTKIGDPSARDKTRPILTADEIKKNADTYAEQVGAILNLEKIEIRRNSEWLDKLSVAEFLSIASKMTAASILERDDFEKRFRSGNDIGLHELLYPVMQAYDSVVIKADLEVGGTDQKFNLLAGRELMKKLGMKPQAILTTPILIGTDGVRKMSKSLGNYIALNDPPSEMFGKVMSIPDKLIIQYYELVTDVTKEGLEVIKKELNDGKNPRDIKAKLAYLIIEIIYNSEEARKAQEEFDRVFKNRETPSEIEVKKIENTNMKLTDLLIACGSAYSKSEASRLAKQGGVEIDREKITDPQANINIKNGMIIRAGKKRFIKIQSSDE